VEIHREPESLDSNGDTNNDRIAMEDNQVCGWPVLQPYLSINKTGDASFLLKKSVLFSRENI
jgi:hypothetical protein